MIQFRVTKLMLLLGSLVIQHSLAESVVKSTNQNFPFSLKTQPAFGGNFSRRDYLGLTASLVGGLVPRVADAKDTPKGKGKESDFTIFKVHPDTSAQLSPSLEHIKVRIYIF